MSLLQNSNAISSGGYNIANSLRFQSASSQSLTRTPAGAGNRKTWTWSGWVKRGLLGTAQGLYATTNPVVGSGSFGFVDSPANSFYLTLAGIGTQSTTAVFRDPSAWYHVVLAFDSTQATQANRCKLYVNGVQYTFTTNIVGLNTDYEFNNNTAQQIGTSGVTGGTTYTDGYLAEVNFIDGQALTPSSFGETDTLTGQWVAKKYTGTYGTNGFYLPFSNGTSTTTLGADGSGNSNNWTLNNFTRSAGVSDCWMYDVPSGNGSVVGGTQPNSNYATFNPTISNTTNLINANLTRNGAVRTNVASIICASGKYYFETTIQDANGTGGVGVKQATAYPLEGYDTSKSASYFANGEYKIEGGTQTSGFSSYTNGDVIGIAVDTTISPAKIWFAKNNTWQGTGNPTTAGYSLTAGLDYYFMVLHGSGSGSTTASANFGQRSFAYTPPSGFKALCTANLPASTIVKGNQYMDATLYTGTNAAKSITNAAGFSPDLVWVKNRTHSDAAPYYGVHLLFNTVTGVGNRLMSQSTAVEAFSSQSLTAFNSNGFSIGTDDSIGGGSSVVGDSFVAWQWDAGSSTVTNTSGTISSQVRANPTAGVSVVTYTGTGANATVGHGLGVAPKWFFIKARGAAVNWTSYHEPLGNTAGLHLNTTGASDVNSGFFNNTSPTSSTIAIGSGSTVNTNGGTYVAYCFAEIAGFSKFGSYTGNGSTDGPMVWTGFAPRYVMIKQTNGANDWWVMDTARDPYNVGGAFLSPNLSNAESSGNVFWDALSNGFKLRNLYSQVNGNGNTYIYMAFASNPFSSSNAK